MSDTPVVVDFETISSYELRSGFVGLGKFFEQKGLVRIVGGDSCEA